MRSIWYIMHIYSMWLTDFKTIDEVWFEPHRNKELYMTNTVHLTLPLTVTSFGGAICRPLDGWRERERERENWLAFCVLILWTDIFLAGITYSTLSLLSTVLFLVLATHLNGWKLDKKYGIILMVWYLIFITFASLYELNVFGNLNPPECPSNY